MSQAFSSKRGTEAGQESSSGDGGGSEAGAKKQARLFVLGKAKFSKQVTIGLHQELGAAKAKRVIAAERAGAKLGAGVKAHGRLAAIVNDPGFDWGSAKPAHSKHDDPKGDAAHGAKEGAGAKSAEHDAHGASHEDAGKHHDDHQSVAGEADHEQGGHGGKVGADKAPTSGSGIGGGEPAIDLNGTVYTQLEGSAGDNKQHGATATGKAAKDTQHATPAAQPAPPQVEGKDEKGGPLSETKALAVLDDAFKGYTKVSKGTVKLLDQSDFHDAYDAVYGKTDYSWDKWVKPKFGNLNGFAHENVNYINKATANTGTVPHEMLHNNAAADWRPFVGNEFDEGATDYLKQHALKKAGLSSPNSYEAQLAVVKALLITGVSDDKFFTAYLKGGAAEIVGKWTDEHCAGKWTEVKEASQAKDFAKAKVKLAPKVANDAKKDSKAK